MIVYRGSTTRMTDGCNGILLCILLQCWLSLVLGGSKESASGGTKPKDETDGKKQETTWVHELFQGQTTNETKCLNCETVRYHKSSLV